MIRCSIFCKRNGVALALVFIVLVVLFIAGVAISQLMQGLQRQMVYADASIRCQYIAEAAMNLQLEKLLQKPWADRWFAGSSDSGTNIAYDRGTYDYFIHDTPTIDYHADLWIQSQFGDTTRAFFWRIKFDRGLMGGLSQGVAVNRVTLKKSAIPVSASNVDKYTDTVEEILIERKDKTKVARQIASDISSTISADRALSEIDVIAPEGIRKDIFADSNILKSPIFLPMNVSIGSPDPGEPLSDGSPPNIEEDLDRWIEAHIPADILTSTDKKDKKNKVKKEIKKIKKLMKKGKARKAKRELKKLMKALNKKYGAKFGSKPVNENVGNTVAINTTRPTTGGLTGEPAHDFKDGNIVPKNPWDNKSTSKGPLPRPPSQKPQGRPQGRPGGR